MGLVRALSRLGFLMAMAASAASSAATVELFTPQGEVKGVRQVTARFSEPMLPFGDPRLVEPFNIDCPQKGSARWADPKNWVFDFEHDLPAGVRCRFSLKTAVTTDSGAPLEAATFEFTTGGPAILEHLPYEGSPIDEEQAFILGLDSHATMESVLANAWCDVKGIKEKIGVKLIEGKDREAILNGRPEFLKRFARLFLSGSRMDRMLSSKDGQDDLPLVVLQCKRRFPNGAQVKLVWGRGIASRSDVPSSRDQALVYTVRPEFRGSFSCERVNAKAVCLPIAPMRLTFTAPVARKQAQLVTLEDAAGRPFKAALPDTGDAGDFADSVVFTPPFPENTSFKLEIPAGLRDDAGRKLANAGNFPLSVKTDESPPLAKFPATFGIIESQVGGELPVTLRNVENPALATTLKASMHDGKPIPGKALSLRTKNAAEIIHWLRRIQLTTHDEWVMDSKGGTEIRRPAGSQSVFAATDKTLALSVPKPEGAAAFEVIGIPLKGTGLHIVEIASPKLGAALLVEPPKDGDKPKPGAAPVYYAPAAALVTNLSVHFKQGRESSLVWVTRLNDGKPVAKVAVSVQDCQGREYWQGSSGANGIAHIKSELPRRERLPACLASYDRQYVVIARNANDMSFVLSDWNEGISRWRFNLPSGDWPGPHAANTVFDRTLVRVGDTVHMKHFYRKRVGQGFAFIKAEQLPANAKIRHRGSEQDFEMAVKWDARATAESQWEVPAGAKTGTYEVVFEDTLGERGEKAQRVAGSFRVEEFRVPTMRAFVQPPSAPQVNVERVPLGVQVSYLSGGGASNQTVKLRGMVQPRGVFFPGYEGFTWAAARVREGIERPGAWRWMSEEYETEDGSDEEELLDRGSGGQRRTLRQVGLTLDTAGAGRAELAGVPRAETPQELLAEMEYADANGEILTAAARIALWPSALVLGIKPDSWAGSKEQLKFQVVALDLQGNPAPRSDVSVELFQRLHYTHRKRLVGGFYGYESGQEVKRLKTVCEGSTDEKGRLFCETQSPVGGEVILQAQSKDAEGRLSVTQTSTWVADKADWWFDVSNDDRMDLIPERKRYEPGEKAVFQVRMPFREATALVTVEREGVLEAFVRTLSGKSPVISVPMAGHHAPNVFVSVLAVRGRVAGVSPTALVDLGKPSFKMGVAEVQVGWAAHEMKVSVTTDRKVYKARDKVKIEIEARRALDGKPAKGAEAILVAVDEGLLELAPNESWKLLDAMMQRRGIEVDTATASMQVVGKRHYGRKALPPGGGGGRQSSRELFDTLLFWKARVKLDEKGHASAEIPLNDSLTAFRIVAVVHAGAGLFGSGYTSVRSTQDLQLLSGLPPLVREQDRFQARFTVRNASEREMHTQVSAKWSARTDRELSGQFEPVSVSLAPGEAKDIGWEMKTPLGADSLHWEAVASSGDQSDRLKITQKVIPVVDVRTFQATIAQLDGRYMLPVQIPMDAVAERGGVRITLQRSLNGELSGVREFMDRYPYTCLEQRVSQAVALRDEKKWQRVVNDLPSHLDGDGLAKYFHNNRYGSEVLTTYLLQISNEAGWEFTGSPRSRMEEALVGFVEGRVHRISELPTADLSIRKVAALEALVRGGRQIKPEWLQSLAIEPNLWPTSAVIDWHSLLMRSGQIPGRDLHLAQAEQILRSRLNFQGTTMGFSTERSDYLWWLMAHGDVNANRVLLSFLSHDKWKEDVPRMVRGTLGRQQRGAWSTTVANAWGVLAMEQFSRSFERNPVTGTTGAMLAGQKKEHPWQDDQLGGSFQFAWPKQKETIEIAHRGEGRPWITLQSLAAIPLREPFSSGFKIARGVTAVERKQAHHWSRGDVIRVRLDLESQADMTWVVVRDPVPAGATLLGTGLGRDSQILASGEKKLGWVWPAFEERTFESFRAYYRFVPKGKWTLEYSLRLNNPGEFQLPETRVEAMYAPEMFAEIPNERMSIVP